MSGLLDGIPLFSALSPEELARVEPIFSRITRPSGDKVLNEGDSGEEMYILIKGRVRVSKSMLLSGLSIPMLDVEDPRKVLATLEGSAKPVFGEMALLDRDKRSATVEVIEDATFLATDRTRFFELVEREPVIGSKLLMAIGRRLAGVVRKNNEDLVKLTTALALALSSQGGGESC